MKKFLKLFVVVMLTCTTLVFTLGIFTSPLSLSAMELPAINYQAHVEDKGWLDTVHDNEIAGTVNQSKRLEALILNLKENDKSMVRYRAHIADVGWQAWVTSGAQAGTTDKAIAIQAFQAELTNEYKDMYDIYYRVHVPYRGWLGWAKNGETAGTIGGRIQSEAIEIKLVPRNSTFDRGGVAFVDATITIRDRIVDAAHSRLGCPYVWGGNGPNTFDCSGLVKWCYAQVGISIPRTTGELKSYGTQISVSQALPGDILWKSGHVGIYIGNGQYIHAPQTGDVVKISSVSSGNFTFARRSNEL